ncbi:sulfatase [Halorubrum laminariae]|uniref:Sulfatase n=1 Tax=Halorubrum laminariae TaxID=1433523 RepID=A0ABD6C313_9EURY|nr:sulfatase [Halorubrum laminariae]
MGKPNVLLIVLDTARAQAVYDEEVMPNLNQFAEKSLKFTNAFTTAPWSLPSHSSLFTGEYTSNHRTHADSQHFDPDIDPLAERFRQGGYRTVAFSNNVWISPTFGFDQGFDGYSVGWELFENSTDIVAIAKEYDSTVKRVKALVPELFSIDSPKTIVNALYSNYLRKFYDSGAWLTNRRIRHWLESNSNDEPFFMFVNYLEPHLDYDPPKSHIEEVTPESVEAPSADELNQNAWSYIAGDEDMSDDDFEDLRLLYDAELRYLDKRLGQLFRYLSESGLLDDTVVVVTGDHGENIGDYGLMDHQYCLYDTLLNVPLLAHYPDSISPGIREDLVEIRELYPTLLDIADVESPASTDRNFIRDGAREAVFAEYRVPQPSLDTLREKFGELPQEVLKYDRGLRAVRTQQWKFIEGTDGAKYLFNVDKDPHEQMNVVNMHPDVVSDLEMELNSQLAPISHFDGQSETEMDASVESHLEELGYLQ